MKLSEEQVAQEVLNIHNQENWGIRKYIHVKNYKDWPTSKFAIMRWCEKASIYKDTFQLKPMKTYESTKDLVEDGWIVD